MLRKWRSLKESFTAHPETESKAILYATFARFVALILQQILRIIYIYSYTTFEIPHIKIPQFYILCRLPQQMRNVAPREKTVALVSLPEGAVLEGDVLRVLQVLEERGGSGQAVELVLVLHQRGQYNGGLEIWRTLVFLYLSPTSGNVAWETVAPY